MLQRSLIIAVAGISISGCVSITYAPPTTGEVATVAFQTPDQTINNPVMLHTDKCSDKDAKLIGLLNSKAIGVPKVSRIETKLAANKVQSVSMMAGKFSSQGLPMGGGTFSSRTESCRRIVDFVPKANAHYEISFVYENGKCYYPVFEVVTDASGKQIRTLDTTAKVRESCDLPTHWSPM